MPKVKDKPSVCTVLEHNKWWTLLEKNDLEQIDSLDGNKSWKEGVASQCQATSMA